VQQVFIILNGKFCKSKKKHMRENTWERSNMLVQYVYLPYGVEKN